MARGTEDEFIEPWARYPKTLENYCTKSTYVNLNNVDANGKAYTYRKNTSLMKSRNDKNTTATCPHTV
jgi:hypothetical protein